jgi:hypothetical protein
VIFLVCPCRFAKTRKTLPALAFAWRVQSVSIDDTFPRPKCGRKLQRSGDVEVEDATFPGFQCDEYIGTWKVEGENFETAFTFAVDAEGKPFDPASESGELPL